MLALVALVTYACSEDDSNNSNDGTAKMSVRLTDAPGDYDAVFIDVREVVVKYNGSEDEVSIGNVNAGVYDLLELTGGVTVLLVDGEVPAGDISEIRLILGENNSIVVDGVETALKTPSAQQSGLKIKINETLNDGILYEFVLDFDVDKSIVARGNGEYNLKPVIRASTVAETGAISGSVTPIRDAPVLVTATNGLVEVSAFTDAAGKFFLRGVPEGVYVLTFESSLTIGIPTVTVVDVNVSVGAVTTIDPVNLP